MRVMPVPTGAVGADMLTPLSQAQIIALADYTIPGTRTGFTFLSRYTENLSLQEISNILASGLGLMLVGESRPNGWLPSAGLGAADGMRELRLARALGADLPGMTIGCDLEGMSGGPQETIDYSKAWCGVIQPAHLIAMGYNGSGVPLTPQGLYQLPFTRYWKSLSNVGPVANVDYCMLQLYPTLTLTLPTGLLDVDLDCVQEDKLSRLPTMLVA
jgi:hypothetical protein